jgi:RNase H-fold protein (predicted Holliday junction resolvase)
MRQHEFVNAVKSHLIGLNVKDFSERGKIDRISAETILEEMYDDSQVRPSLAGLR